MYLNGSTYFVTCELEKRRGRERGKRGADGLMDHSTVSYGFNISLPICPFVPLSIPSLIVAGANTRVRASCCGCKLCLAWDGSDCIP
jgi:hypothetical protein